MMKNLGYFINNVSSCAIYFAYFKHEIVIIIFKNF